MRRSVLPWESACVRSDSSSRTGNRVAAGAATRRGGGSGHAERRDGSCRPDGPCQPSMGGAGDVDSCTMPRFATGSRRDQRNTRRILNSRQRQRRPTYSPASNWLWNAVTCSGYGYAVLPTAYGGLRSDRRTAYPPGNLLHSITIIPQTYTNWNSSSAPRQLAPFS